MVAITSLTSQMKKLRHDKIKNLPQSYSYNQDLNADLAEFPTYMLSHHAHCFSEERRPGQYRPKLNYALPQMIKDPGSV